jgi:hypothetical protein
MKKAAKKRKYPLRGTGWVISFGKVVNIRFVQESRHASLLITSPRDIKGDRYGDCFSTEAACTRVLLKQTKQVVDNLERAIAELQDRHQIAESSLARLSEQLKAANAKERKNRGRRGITAKRR